MEAIWYLLVLAPFITVPILWWNYRRKVAEREDLSGSRWDKLVVTARDGEAASAGNAAASVTPARYPMRSRMLDPAQTVLYYLLKNGLPDHEIMPQVGLASLLDVAADIAGSEREQRLRGLAQHRIDFVVCNKAMQPVAAVDLLEQEAQATLTTAPDFRTQCFAHSGIRYLRLVRSAMPGRKDIRALVLGA